MDEVLIELIKKSCEVEKILSGNYLYICGLLLNIDEKILEENEPLLELVFEMTKKSINGVNKYFSTS